MPVPIKWEAVCYTCAHWCVGAILGRAPTVKWLLWDLSLMVLAGKPSVRSSRVSFLWLVTHPNISEDPSLPTGEQQRSKQKERGRPGASKSGAFCESYPVPKRSLFCYFSFSCLHSLCAIIRSRGRLKRQTVGSLVAVCFSIGSLLIKNWAWILGTNDVEVSLLCMLHIN